MLGAHATSTPAIQMFISLVTMEPASLLAHYSAIAADHNVEVARAPGTIR